MPIAPPQETLLEQAPLALMELFGRMRSLTDQAGFRGVLPAIWQCSDESQGIKKALFGYVYDCPAFNLGRVGALLDPTRLATAAYHGRDLVILGGSHIGGREEGGIGYIERVHGEVVPCCGMLRRMLEEYLQSYRRAAQLIKVFRGVGGIKIEIPYKYLFKKPVGEQVRIRLHLDKLVDGDALREGTLGKIYRLNGEFQSRHPKLFEDLTNQPQPLGELLAPDLFSFIKQLDHSSLEPRSMLEVSVFDFLPEIVASSRPHRRLCDVNTWRQFHRLASYITDSFEGSGRNILVLAGLTIDHTIRHNTLIPQFGFWMEGGQALQARYFGPLELNELLLAQPVYRPPQTFLEHAGID